MALSAADLNTARFNSVLADVQAQFPLPAGLQAAEQAAYNAYQQKFAHAVADHEGTDVVAQITGNMDVLPIARSGLGLQNPAGQPVNGTETTAPANIIGLGSAQ